MSQAFEKVWHKGLIVKLKQNGISDKILNIITAFLGFRKQRVVLNAQSSLWVSVEAGYIVLTLVFVGKNYCSADHK